MLIYNRITISVYDYELIVDHGKSRGFFNVKTELHELKVRFYFDNIPF